MASSSHTPAKPASPAAATAAAARASTVAASLALPSSHDPVVRIPVWVGIIVRVLLFTYTDAAPYFRNRVEVVTPITSWKRLQEGLFLYQHGIPPYEGGVFHQAPLLLIVFNFLPPILIPLVFILLDYWIARALVAVAIHKRALQIAEPVDSILHPDDIGSMYLLNPYSIMTCLAQSTLLFTLLAMVTGLQYAIAGKRAASMMCLAIAAYLSLYPVMMVAPAVLLLAQRRAISVCCRLKAAAPLFLGFLATLLGLSYLLIGSWEFLPSTYGVILAVSDLTPNIGLFWYFFIEMFDQFRPFFLCVFQIMVFVFVMPISLVFRDHPLFVAFAISGIMAIFKPYPSVGDTALYLTFFAMHQELYKYMRNNYLVFAAMLFATVLGPLFHYLWVYAGSGNANFYFAITLVFGLARIILLTDTGHALVLREWERLHPDLRRRRVEIVHK
ncbi:GPI transamidase subunit PIG-U [Geranomyces variabilis]|nr:GPI transamidase subunit PIG-U [Geranomyces variabilis]